MSAQSVPTQPQPIWEKKWDSVSVLTLGGVTLAEIAKSNGSLYAFAVDEDGNRLSLGRASYDENQARYLCEAHVWRVLASLAQKEPSQTLPVASVMVK